MPTEVGRKIIGLRFRIGKKWQVKNQREAQG